jgi:outer membrane immunogenic protein
MKKLAIALTAIAAFTAPALAADMAVKTPMRAAPVAYAPSWTGCYISGGGGYGIYRVNHDERNGATGALRSVNATDGGDGWLATAGGGCDYQFNNRWVVGAFADGTWSDLRGDGMARVFGVGDAAVGQLKSDWSWAAGGRIGYLVNPSFLTYVNTGYTQAHFKAQNLNDILVPSAFTGIQIPGQTFDGFFVGTGVEYAFDWLPGLFIRSEGRAAWYNRKDVLPTCISVGTTCAAAAAPGLIAGNSDIDSRRPIIYTAKTELVYRFNWGGPVAGRY